MITIPFLPSYTIVLTDRHEGSFRNAEIVKKFLTEQDVKKEIGYLSLLHGSKRIHWQDKPLSDPADAVLTDNTDLCLSMVVADCFPIILIDRKQNVMAMIHGGWRSLLQNIIQLTMKEMEYKYKSKPEDIYVWIGPGIRACSNITQKPPIQSLFPEWKAFVSENDAKFAVDLVGYIKDSLEQCHIPHDNIFDYGLCTYCEKDAFFSHRRSTLEGDEEGRFIVAVYKN